MHNQLLIWAIHNHTFIWASSIFKSFTNSNVKFFKTAPAFFLHFAATCSVFLSSEAKRKNKSIDTATLWRNRNRCSSGTQSVECKMQEFRQARGAIPTAHVSPNFSFLSSSKFFLYLYCQPSYHCLHFFWVPSIRRWALWWNTTWAHSCAASSCCRLPYPLL